MYFNTKEIIFILDENNNPWFKAKNIAEILDYFDLDQAIEKYVENDNKMIIDESIIYINKAGMYSLISSSKKKEAKMFKKWIKRTIMSLIDKYDEYNKKIVISKQLDKKIKQMFEQIKQTNEEIKLIKEKIQQKNIQLQKEIQLKNHCIEYYNKLQSL